MNIIIYERAVTAIKKWSNCQDTFLEQGVSVTACSTVYGANS